ncbi:transcriptional regulator, partial [Mycobacterium sp. ITM-2017-0098]
RAGVQTVLAAYDPFPCVVVDRGWWILQANSGAAVLLDGVAPQPFHQMGSPLREIADPRREVGAGGSAELAGLLTEIDSYPG